MEGHITVIRLKGGWFWIIPLDKEKTSVGMVQEVDELRKASLTPEESFEKTIQDSTELQFRMKDTVRLSEFYTSSNYSYSYTKIAGPRMVMIGDSGGFIDPIFSSGVMIALRSGQMAAEWIAKADSEQRSFSPAEQIRFTNELHHLRKAFSQMISFYYTKHGFELFINPQSRFRVVEAVNSLLAGHIEMKFNHWWRVQFFYFICWLQRWFELAPRLNYEETAGLRNSRFGKHGTPSSVRTARESTTMIFNDSHLLRKSSNSKKKASGSVLTGSSNSKGI
jgi:hypothetical protein